MKPFSFRYPSNGSGTRYPFEYEQNGSAPAPTNIHLSQRYTCHTHHEVIRFKSMPKLPGFDAPGYSFYLLPKKIITDGSVNSETEVLSV